MRIISVGGGKGGVGKSLVAANLAVALAEQGARVVAIDADLGCANLHTLFGIERAKRGLLSFLEHEVETLNDAITATSIANLGIVVGVGAVVGSANIGWAQKQRLLKQIRAIEADVVVIDVGAGTSYNVLDLFDVAHIRLMTVCPNLASAQNAFSFFKGAVVREVLRIAKTLNIEVDLAGGGETEKLAATFTRFGNEYPNLGDRIVAAQQGFNAALIGNQITRASDMDMIYGLSRMASDFFGVSALVVGALHQRAAIADSVSARRPFLLTASATDAEAVTLRRVARTLLEASLSTAERAFPSLERGVPNPDSATSTDFGSPYRRGAERYPVDWDATLEDGGEVTLGRVVDVSDSGACFRSPLGRAISTHASFTLRVAPINHGIGAKVRWVSADATGLSIGLELLSHSGALVNALGLLNAQVAV